MEEEKTKLLSSAVSLLMNYNIPQGDMFKWIREELKEKVGKMPKERVLYNTVHGGMGLSEEFEEFISHCPSNIYDKEVRTSLVKHILPFGKKIANKYSGLTNLLYLYDEYRVGHLVYQVRQWIRLEREKEILTRNFDILCNYLSNPHSTYSNKTGDDCVRPCYYTMISIPNFSHYTRTDLEQLKTECMEVFGDKINQQIDDLRNQLQQAITEDLMYDMKDYFYLLDKRREEYKRDLSRSYRRDTEERTTFMNGLNRYGYEYNSVWKYQVVYDSDAIQFLLYLRSQWVGVIASDPITIYDYFLLKEVKIANPDLLNLVYEKFGLLCASGQYSNLAIAEMPAKMEWQVGDYDGKETVYIV
jgi:hypothetical protein